MKHMPSRWLSIGPAATRVVELGPTLSMYFAAYIPKKTPCLMKSDVFKEII